MATADHRSGPNVTLWVVVGIPALTILASLFTLYVSVVRAEPELPSNYHSEGAELDADLARSERAAELGVTVRLRLDHDGMIEAVLRMHSPSDQPAELALHLTHATFAAEDRRVTLRRHEDGVYRARTAAIPPAHWLLEIGVPEQWRVRGNLPATSRTILLGRAPG